MRLRFLLLANLLIFKAFAENPQTSFVRFVRNDGQWEDNIRFKADLPGGYLFVRNNSLNYVFYDTEMMAAMHAGKVQEFTSARQSKGMHVHGVDVFFEGANLNPIIETKLESTEKRHYFLGNDASTWKSNVPAFGEITFKNIYLGIDLHLFTYGSSLKYEFVVSPGADITQIKMRYSGAEKVKLENDNLLIKTSLNTIKELKPYCYQETNGKSLEVTSAFQLSNETATFQFPEGYNKKLPLVIDPVLIFSSFSGLTSDNWGHTATYDHEGNLYSGGTANFSLRQVNGQTDVDPNLWDLAILKYNPDGTKLLSISFIGGEYTEVPHSLVVNSKNELLIFGTTSSRNFPMHAKAYDPSFNGGFNITGVSGMTYPNGSDIFVVKLSPKGDSLRGSTFIGGSSNDGLNFTRNSLQIRNYGDEYRGEIVVDDKDNVYIASVTPSSNFPVVNPASIQRGGVNDAVVMRLSPDLSQLQWSTFVGGNGFDAAYSVKATSSGAVYVSGATSSNNLEVKTGSFKGTFGGVEDGFVAKYVGDKLQQITYLGTDQADVAQLLDLDKDENVYVIGLTAGKYVVSSGVYQNAGSGQFIQSLDKDLSKSVFSTVIGSGRGTLDIIPTAFLVSECGNIYLSGWGGEINSGSGSSFTNQSSTKGLPVTSDAYRPTTDGSNFYIMILEKGAKSLLYATFFGSTNVSAGDHVDGGTCRFDKQGFIYHAACCCNRSGSPSNFTTTPTAWSRTNPSLNCNNAAFKFDIDILKVNFDVFQGTKKDVVEGCAPLSLRFVNTSIGGKTYEWDLGGLQKSNSAGEVSYTFDKGGEYVIVLKGTNPLTCNREEIARRTIKVTATDFKVIPDQKICTGGSVQLTASGGVSYKWTPVEGLSKADIPNPVVTPKINTRYTVEITDAKGCSLSQSVNVDIDRSFEPKFELIKNYDCGKPVTLQFDNKTANADRFVWVLGNGDSLTTATPSPYIYKVSGSYQVTLKSYKGTCELMTSKPIEIEAPLEVTNVITPNGDGKNDTFVTGTKGIKLEIYSRWGKLLYQTDSYQNDWGKGIANGTYYYLITTTSGSKCKGWLEILE